LNLLRSAEDPLLKNFADLRRSFGEYVFEAPAVYGITHLTNAIDCRKAAIRQPMWKLLDIKELVKVLIIPNTQVPYLHRSVDAHSVQLRQKRSVNDVIIRARANVIEDSQDRIDSS
jgi:hypothetical protein